MESISIQARGRLSGGGGRAFQRKFTVSFFIITQPNPPPPLKKKAQVSVFQYLIEI